MNKQRIRLLQNLLILGILIAVASWIVNYFRADAENKEWELTETPLKVESVRAIAEIGTVSYQDEVVVDSVEYYDGLGSQIAGNISKLADPDQFSYAIRGSAEKRRITLIVRGEVHYGFDLNQQKMHMQQSEDTIRIHLPHAKVLDVVMTPSSTEVFQENGDWSDYALTQLENKARRKLLYNAKKLNLDKKAEENVRTLLERLVAGKHLIVYFD